MVNAAFTVDDEIARVELQRPEALNAVDLSTKRELTEWFRAVDRDDDVRVVILQSEGEAFCAGGDIHEVREHDFALQPFTDTWEELFEAMTTLDAPIVARIDGYALGGGFDLMLHTDIPIAAHEAKLGQPEVGLGIVNHFSPPLLLERVGMARTLDLMLTGDTISGREAAHIGLVARSVEADALDETVDALATKLAGHSPRVLRKLKSGIYRTLDMSPTAAREHLEAIALDAARTDPDYREGVTAKLEDRQPEWD